MRASSLGWEGQVSNISNRWHLYHSDTNLAIFSIGDTNVELIESAANVGGTTVGCTNVAASLK
jgi:hypothetical protein